MIPIAMAANAIPMVTGLLGKGMDMAKSATDLINQIMPAPVASTKVGWEEQRPQHQIKF